MLLWILPFLIYEMLILISDACGLVFFSGSGNSRGENKKLLFDEVACDSKSKSNSNPGGGNGVYQRQQVVKTFLLEEQKKASHTRTHSNKSVINETDAHTDGRQNAIAKHRDLTTRRNNLRKTYI